MPKAIRPGAAPATVSRPETGPPLRDPADPSNPWADAATDPAADGWPADGQAQIPPIQAMVPPDGDPPVVEPQEGAPVAAGPSEAGGEAPVTQETPPAARATKRAPAKRAQPAPVQAAPRGEMAETHDGGLQLAALDDTEDKISLLIYGPEGVGKTTGICTAANHGRILVINAEGGLKVTPLRARGIDTANISVFPPKGRSELLTEANLERLFWQVKADLDRDPGAWYAVAWDSVTEIGSALLRQIVEREVAKNAALPEGSAKRKDFRESADFTDRGDYGVLSNQMLPLLRKYRDLPCHFLVTALERRDEDEDTGRVMYAPATTPAVQTALLGYVDVAIRVKNDAGEDEPEPRFVGRTRPARNTRAKDRFGVTPPVLPDPSFEQVRAYIDGDLKYEPPAGGEAVAEPAEPGKQTGKKRAPASRTATGAHTETN